MKLTLSAIKADVGSTGGHTKPTAEMRACALTCIQQAIKEGTLIDGTVTHTGDDIALIMSHTHGNDSTKVHQFAWHTFLEITDVARQQGCYAAGQDLLADAPSGNIRGAGPGVAEITFNHEPKDPRKSESFMVFAADKCDLGAFNLPLCLAFTDPMYCAGLMLPPMIKGFTFDIIDMNSKEHRSITLNAPEDNYYIALLLRDNERFGIKAIYSRTYDEQVVSVSTDRLHTIAGKYVGKDDPIALVRNQGIFPAPEEIVSPYVKAHYVGGGTRGSHTMPLMPVALNTAVTGPYCVPIVSCVGFSVTNEGTFAHAYVDFFNNPVWDYVRLKAQEKAIEMRLQGWSGCAMLPYGELEYSGFKTVLEALLARFDTKQ